MLHGEINFNSNPDHFEPTDIFWVRQGSSIRKALEDSDLAFLLVREDLLKQILAFHDLEKGSLDILVENDQALIVNHPKMYMRRYQEHPCFQAYRNRSFDFFELRVLVAGQKSVLDKFFDHSNEAHCILELGSGSGRALLELQNKFPHSQVYGMSLPQESVDLRLVADFFDLKYSRLQHPQVIEADLNKENFRSVFKPQADLIFSQASMRYIRDKVSLIENIWQALKVGGVAILELQLMEIVDQKGEKVLLEDFFASAEWQGNFYFEERTKLLFLFKNSNREIKLPLTFLENKSQLREPVAAPERNEEVGWTSIYQRLESKS